MADTLKDYLVGIEFEVDESGANQAESMMDQLSKIVAALGNVLSQTAEAIKALVDNFAAGAREMQDSTNAMSDAANAARDLSEGEGESSRSAGEMAKNAQEASQSVSEMSQNMNTAAGTAGDMADAQDAVSSAASSSSGAMSEASESASELSGAEQEVAGAAGEAGSAMQDAQGSAEGLAGAETEAAGAANEAGEAMSAASASAGELFGAAGEAAGSMGEAAGAGEQLAEGAESASEAMQETAGAADEVSQAAQDAADSMANAGNAAAQMADAQTVAAEASDDASGSMQGTGGAARALEGAEKAVASAAHSASNALKSVAGASHGASSAHMAAASGARQHATAMREAGNSTRTLSGNLRDVDRQGRLEGLKQGSRNTNELARSMHQAANMTRRLIKAAATYIIGSNITSIVKNVIDFTDNLASSAKELGKSIEDARAYNVALEAIGKTAKEIEADGDLKATFENLQDIGKAMALPEAAQGIKTVQGLRESLMQLKVTGNYALQWIYYKTQEIAEGPLTEIKNLIDGMRNWVGNNIESIAEKVGKAFSWVIQLISSVAQAVGWVVNLISGLPGSIKAVGAAALLIIGMVKGKIKPLWVILSAITLLIDDLVTYMQGGDSLFGAFWGPLLEWVEKVKPVLDDIVAKIDGVITAIKNAWTDSTSLLDFVKHLALGEDYDPDESWTTVGTKIWEKIKSGFSTTGNWLWGLLYPDGVPDDIGGDWSEVGKRIVDKITETLKAGFDIAAGLITGITESLTKRDEKTGKLESGLEGLFKGIVTSLVTGMSEVAQSMSGAGTAIVTFVSTLLTKAAEEISGMGDSGTVFDAVSKIATNIITAITDIFSPENMANLGTSVSDFVTAMFGKIAEGIEGAGKATGDILDALGNSAITIATTMLDTLSTILGNINLETVTESAGKAVRSIMEALGRVFTAENGKNLGESVNKFAKALITSVGDAISGLVDALTSVGESAAEGASEGEAVNPIVSLVKSILDSIGAALGELEIGDIITEIGTIARNLITAITSIFTTEIKDEQGNTVNVLGDSLSSFVNNLFTKIGEGISAAGQEVGKATSALGNSVVTIVTNLMTVISDTLKNLKLDDITSAVGTVINSLFDAFTNIFSDKNIETVSGSIKDFLSNLFGAISKGLEGLFGEIGKLDGKKIGTGAADIVTKLLDSIFGGIEDLSTDANVTGFVDELGAGLQTALETLGDIVGSFAGKIIGWIFSGKALTDIWNAGMALGKLLIDGIGAAINGIGGFLGNMVMSLLEGLGLVDSEGRAAYEAQQKAIKESKEQMKQAINEGADDASFYEEGKNFNATLMKALFDGMGDVDQDQADAFYRQFWKNLGNSEDSYDQGTAQQTLESISNNIKNELREAKEKLQRDLENQGDYETEAKIDGATAKELIAPYLESMGLVADSLSAELYQAIADSVVNNAGTEGKVNLFQLILDEFFKQPEETPEVNADVPVNVGAEEVDTTDLEETVETEAEKAISRAKKAAGVEDVDLETHVDVNTEINNKGSEEAKKGTLKEYEETGQEVVDKANEISAEAATAFLAVMNAENGATMAREFVSGLVSGLSETEGLDSAIDAITEKVGSINKKPEGEAPSEPTGQESEQVTVNIEADANYNTEKAVASINAGNKELVDLASKEESVEKTVNEQVTVNVDTDANYNTEKAEATIKDGNEEIVNLAAKEETVEKNVNVKVNLRAGKGEVDESALTGFSALVGENSGGEVGSRFMTTLGSSLTENAELLDEGVATVTGKFTSIGDAMNALVGKVGAVVSAINAKLSQIRSVVRIGFQTTGADTVKTAIDGLARAIKEIPSTITITSRYESEGEPPQTAMGGIFNRPTVREIGEDGEEVVVPVTKGERGESLLRYAANKMGLTVEGIENARQILGGDPMKNTTPAYANPVNNINTTTNNNTNVSAPATINVYGSDPKSIAANVVQSHENIVLRNLKSVIA